MFNGEIVRVIPDIRVEYASIDQHNKREFARWLGIDDQKPIFNDVDSRRKGFEKAILWKKENPISKICKDA